MLNKVMLIGRLVADPEVRFTPNGAQTASFRIAVDRSYKQNEEWKKDTLFVKVTTWTVLAKKVSDYFKKGNLVYVEGRLQIQSYEKNGQKNWFTDIVANTAFQLEKRVGVSGEESPDNHSLPANNNPSAEGFEEYDFIPEGLEEIQ
jgi:single-strand DNA-binding protein